MSFSWVSFYEDFASKLLEYKNNRRGLVAILHSMKLELDTTPMPNFEDKFSNGTTGPLRDICPFTVFATFNRGIKNSNRRKILKKFADVLNISHSLPNDFGGIPVVRNDQTWFFGFESDRNAEDINLLWEFFEKALDFAKIAKDETRIAFIEAYNKAANIKGVKFKLTMGLYWIRPNTFPTLDSQSRNYLDYLNRIRKIELNFQIPSQLVNADEYLAIQELLKESFKNAEFPADSFPCLSLIAWEHDSGPYWFVGADFDGDDQTDHFLENGIWENGHEDKYLDDVLSIKVEQRIAIKSTFSQNRDLPFDYHGKSISVMRIKAIGTVIRNENDGRTVHVKWDDRNERDWYFYTGPFQTTVKSVKRDNRKDDELIEFTFNNQKQDILRFQSEPSIKTTKEEVVLPPPESYSVEQIIEDGCFIDKSRLSNFLNRLQGKKNVILQGPPGTGKTWLSKRLAYALLEERNNTRVRSFQFHPNLSYEDFVRGFRPSAGGELELVDGPFLQLVATAIDDLENKYVVVIEEINRGNPAQIFGEMLTLLEADKRNPESALELCYKHPDNSNLTTYIPDNVYVIGTMNVADRSLALVDMALRRRFAFFDLEPNFNSTWRNWIHQNFNFRQKFLKEISIRITELNQSIAVEPELGPQFCVGHSYFTPSINDRIEDPIKWYEQVVTTEIHPLLKEYWFDNLDTAQDKVEKLLNKFED